MSPFGFSQENQPTPRPLTDNEGINQILGKLYGDYQTGQEPTINSILKYLQSFTQILPQLLDIQDKNQRQQVSEQFSRVFFTTANKKYFRTNATEDEMKAVLSLSNSQLRKQHPELQQLFDQLANLMKKG